MCPRHGAKGFLLNEYKLGQLYTTTSSHWILAFTAGCVRGMHWFVQCWFAILGMPLIAAFCSVQVCCRVPYLKAAVLQRHRHSKRGELLQDPPMRAMSDFIMMRRQHPGCLVAAGNPSRMCPHANSTFLEVITRELQNRKRPLECFFNSTVRFLTGGTQCLPLLAHRVQ